MVVSVSIEADHDRFVIKNDFLIEIIDHPLIRHLARSSHLEILKTIEMLGPSCCSWCASLSSISCKSIASNAIVDPFQSSLADGDSCHEFDQWQQLRASGVVVDFGRICRIGSGLGALADHVFDPSRFNETSILREGLILTKVDQGVDDGFRTIVQSLCLLKAIESERLQQNRRIL
jgi:hypothetical protein